jgi:hypothetical protein
MPTVIDSLIITLGLDPKNFTKGQKEVAEGLTKTRNSADSTAKQMEASGKRAANYFASVKNEVIGLGLAFLGAKGIGDFANDLIGGAAAAGRLSANIGLSTERIGAWQGAVKEMNGTAEDANGALSAMSNAIGNYQLTRSTGNDAVFRALGVNLQDLQAGPDAMLLKIAEAGEHISRRNYVNLVQRLGFSPAMIAVLEQGRAGLEGVLATQEKLYPITKDQARASEEFQKSLADLKRTIEGDAAPGLTKLVGIFNEMSNDKDGMQDFGDVAVGVIGAIAAAAAVAAAPLLALAAAIALVLKAKQDYDKGDPWVSVRHGKPPPSPGAGKGLLGGLAAMWNSDWISVHHAPTGGTGGGGDRPGNNAIERYLAAQGIDPGTAKGIAAGVSAEGGGLGMAANGAFGIGQWRGARKDRLFKQFGPHPDLAAQLQFLVWELKGGDRGGAAVLSAKDPDIAGLAYITRFMRPAAGAETLGDIRRMRGYLQGTKASARHHGGVHIGSITIHGAKDAHGVAKDIHGAIKRRTLATPANSGVN